MGKEIFKPCMYTFWKWFAAFLNFFIISQSAIFFWLVGSLGILLKKKLVNSKRIEGTRDQQSRFTVKAQWLMVIPLETETLWELIQAPPREVWPRPVGLSWKGMVPSITNLSCNHLVVLESLAFSFRAMFYKNVLFCKIFQLNGKIQV